MKTNFEHEVNLVDSISLPGAKVFDFCKELDWYDYDYESLYVLNMGINNIDVKIIEAKDVENHINEIIAEFHQLIAQIKQLNNMNRIIIPTLIPMKVNNAVNKYSEKMNISQYELSDKHQDVHEYIVGKLNDYFQQLSIFECGTVLAFHFVTKRRSHSEVIMITKTYMMVSICMIMHN